MSIRESLKIQHSKWSIKNLFISFSVFLSITFYLSLYSEHKVFWIVVSIFEFMFLISKPKYLIISVVVFLTAFLVRYLTIQHENNKYINGEYKVLKVTSSGFVISDQDNIFVHCHLKLFEGDVVHVSGNSEKIENYSSFDSVSYFKSFNVLNHIRLAKVAIISHSKDIANIAKQFVQDSSGSYAKVSPLILLGIRDENTDGVYQSAIQMNVVHLFVISGFHIVLIFSLFKKSLLKIKVQKDLAQWLSLVPIIFYIFLLNFQTSATRAACLLLLSVINNTMLKRKFKNVELLGFTMAIMFVWKPYSLFSLSFIFTFLSSYAIIILLQIKIKSEVLKIVFIAFGIYLINLPLTIMINGQFSLLGPIYSLVLTPIFSLMFVLTIIMFPMKDYLSYVDWAFLKMVEILSSINVIINAKAFNLEFILALYISLFSIATSCLIYNNWQNKKWTFKSIYNYLTNLSK